MFTMAKLSQLAIAFTVATISVMPARADRLFTGDDWGTSIYELDTTYGGWSKVVFCDRVSGVNGLGVDAKGNLYESDFGGRAIYKFTPDGNYTVFANLDSPGAAMAFDGEGNLFMPFQWGGRIDKLSPDGSTSSTFATGVPQPVQLIFDSHGELFASDQRSGSIYEFDPDDGTRTTFATGLRSPIGLAFDRHGVLFVADPPARAIYKYSTNGVRSTFTRWLKSPCCLAFDSQGNLFMSSGSGDIFEFKNKGGTLAKKPVLFATGMGHNYFMTIMPGSMPAGILISKAMMLCKPWLPFLLLFVLLMAGTGLGIWLYRKKRRAALTTVVKNS
jgi:sugar lactone lactonase YvrE